MLDNFTKVDQFSRFHLSTELFSLGLKLRNVVSVFIVFMRNTGKAIGSIFVSYTVLMAGAPIWFIRDFLRGRTWVALDLYTPMLCGCH